MAASLALCREFGKPPHFSTVTTNQHWPKIKECLYPGQNVSHQPGVVAPAFKVRMSLMMKAIWLVDNASIIVCHLFTFVAVTTWVRYFTKLRLSNPKREAYHMPI